jgi:hypothetical protein
MSSADLRRENVIIVMAGGPLPCSVQYRRSPAPSFPQAIVAAREEAAVAQTALEKSFPPLTAQAANLFQSVGAFVGDGCALVDDAEYGQRLETCRACDRRNGKRCTACGCWIAVKARGRTFACPLGRWEEVRDEG